MQFNIFTVRGAISSRNIVPTQHQKSDQKSSLSNRTITICKLNKLNTVAPDTAEIISSLLDDKTKASAVETMLAHASYQFIDDAAFSKQFSSCTQNTGTQQLETIKPRTAYGWANSEEWATLKAALRRDREVIIRAAKDANIEPRLIIAGVIGEQFRFFTGLRTSFKNYFEPLKIFGRLSKFSYGIAGLKPDTVRLIEQHLNDSNSPYYIGPEYKKFTQYSSAELESSSDPQLARITDPTNNYYSYLYTGLYMRQITQQWANAGYDISNNAGVLATLYNLGFRRSIPKQNPQPGGAIITVNDREYTFGQIAEEFYWSGELLSDFPYSKE